VEGFQRSLGKRKGKRRKKNALPEKEEKEYQRTESVRTN